MFMTKHNGMAVCSYANSLWLLVSGYSIFLISLIFSVCLICFSPGILSMCNTHSGLIEC